MCHGEASAALPDPDAFEPYTSGIQAAVFGAGPARRKVALLPDIYGCNPFYQGLATQLSRCGARVYLVDTFAGLGDLPKATREAAFQRRHRLKDREFVDRFVEFARREGIDGVAGFCLGGLFVFELARRDLDAALVGLYPFPQGLENQDPVPVPFDYLADVTRSHTILVGTDDASLGPEHLERLRGVALASDALDLHVFDGSGHGFLGDLDSDDAALRTNAERALETTVRALGLDLAGLAPS